VEKTRKKVQNIRELPSRIKLIKEIPRAEALNWQTEKRKIKFEENSSETASNPSDISLIINPENTAPIPRDFARNDEGFRKEEEKNPYAIHNYERPKKKTGEYESSNTGSNIKQSGSPARDRPNWENEPDLGLRSSGDRPSDNEGRIYESHSQNLSPERKKKNSLEF